LISLIDPCNLYFQGDILFALLVESTALPNNNNQLAEAAEFIEDKGPYYKYTPANVLENENFMLYWNRSILTEKNTFLST